MPSHVSQSSFTGEVVFGLIRCLCGQAMPGLEVCEATYLEKFKHSSPHSLDGRAETSRRITAGCGVLGLGTRDLRGQIFPGKTNLSQVTSVQTNSFFSPEPSAQSPQSQSTLKVAAGPWKRRLRGSSTATGLRPESTAQCERRMAIRSRSGWSFGK